jgi:hypothetical protein
MGLIRLAAKVGAKKDIALDKISDQIDSTVKLTKETTETVKKFASAPVSFVSTRYDAAKVKALEEEKAKTTAGNSSEPNKLNQGMKKVVKGAAIAAGAAAIATSKKAGNAIGNAGESVFEGNPGNALSFLLIIAIFTHFLDWATDFNRPGFMIFVYVGMFLYAFIFLFHMRVKDSNEIALFIIILVAYCLPIALMLIKDSNIILWLTMVIVMFPILPLYIGLQFPSESIFSKLTKVYIFGFLIFMLFNLMTSFGVGETSKAMITDPFSGVRFFVTTADRTFGKVADSIDTAFERAVAKATGQAYEGEEESRVGIYVEDVKSLESRYNTWSNIYVEAKISAENIKEKINIKTLCYIENVRQGTVVPSILANVTDNYQNTIDCELGQLPAGNYEARVQAIFEFESSSDIQYTFVSDDIKSDQYARLNIDPQTIATYTGGPVELGLPALSQPLRIDATRMDGGIVNYPFGVSLKNKWSQGKVTRGIRYMLSVPPEVELVYCSRNYISMTRNQVNGRNEYVFEMNTSNAQDVFDAITCRMKFVDAPKLLGIDMKSVKTFAARAKYEYMIEQSTQIIVESTE